MFPGSRSTSFRILTSTLTVLAMVSAVPAHAQNARITGRIIDRETQAPIVGAVIELSSPAGGQGFFRAQAGPDGRFTLDRVPPERWYSLVAGAKGYAD